MRIFRVSLTYCTRRIVNFRVLPWASFRLTFDESWLEITRGRRLLVSTLAATLGEDERSRENRAVRPPLFLEMHFSLRSAGLGQCVAGGAFRFQANTSSSSRCEREEEKH